MSDESELDAKKRIERFALRVRALVSNEESQSGCVGVLMGFAIGLMRRGGTPSAEAQAMFEQMLTSVYELPVTNTNPPTEPSEPS